MSFNLKVTFTGVCTFVPDRPIDQTPTKVCVLLPNGENGGVGADKKQLRRHRGFVLFNLKNLVGANGVVDDTEGIWYLGKRELEFRGATAQPLHVQDMSKVVKLSDFAPGFSTVDPTALVGQAVPTKLLSRVVIDRGTLSTGKTSGPWHLPNTLAPGLAVNASTLVPDRLASEVILEMTQLSSLTLAATEFATGKTSTLSLSSNTTVEITIANLCDENPLLWPTQKDSQPDDDFKWHYELLEPTLYNSLRTMVNGLELPFPFPVGSHNGLGMNCFPALAHG